jgi:phosphoglycerate kinase
MQLKTVQSIEKLEEQRVLLRLDLNVPLKNGQVAKEGQERIIRSLPTIKYLQERGAKIIIVAHLGRPEGKVVKKYSLKPVALALSKLLKTPVTLWDKDITSYRKMSEELEAGQVVILENIRFQEREQKNCKRLAKKLSYLADIYVNDAFANIHRQDTSMYTITYFLPSYAGLLLQEEIKYLSKTQAEEAGLVVLLGGAKVSTKIKLIKKFILSAENIMIGGAIANTMLAAKGLTPYKVGVGGKATSEVMKESSLL